MSAALADMPGIDVDAHFTEPRKDAALAVEMPDSLGAKMPVGELVLGLAKCGVSRRALLTDWRRT